MSNDNLFSHFASVLHVADAALSIAFYQQQLGFELTFSWGDPVNYAVLKRGGVSIHVSQKDHLRPHPLATLYIFVFDVDVAYRALQEKGIAIHHPIGDRDYGMRDFDIKDPDGHLLSFGTEIPEDR